MNIAHICRTPVAGAAWAASEAFKEAGFDSCCIARREYADGRAMPSDYPYPPNDEAAMDLWNADLIFCHQGHPYNEPWYPKETPTVFIYHSQPSHMPKPWTAIADGMPWAVIGQYQPRLYGDCSIVPNLIPLKHSWYQAGHKPDDRVRIAYSPSNRSLGGWDDKGYADTMKAFDGLDADIDVIVGVTLRECLARKSAAHIVIDECVTGSYHRSSLEALALGCVVVNNIDAPCAHLIRLMTGGTGHPFVTCHIKALRDTLESLIDQGPDKLTHWGCRNREWMESAWNPKDLIERNYQPLMEKALAADDN